MNWSHYTYSNQEMEDFLIKYGYNIKEKTYVENIHSQEITNVVKHVYKDDEMLPIREHYDRDKYSHITYIFYKIIRDFLLEEILESKRNKDIREF